MFMILYGIPNCDTVKKARAWLAAHGHGYEFHDYKKSGITGEKLTIWCNYHGWDVVLNRGGTTFRNLTDGSKTDLDTLRAVALMVAQPSMIKRPIIETPTQTIVGFTPDMYEKAFA